jgi:hypothetical protein
MSLLERFFVDLERAWAASESIPLRLHVLGSSALMLQTNYRRGTKDAAEQTRRQSGPSAPSALSTTLVVSLQGPISGPTLLASLLSCAANTENDLVDPTGIEPVTSALRTQRSPS